MQGPFRCDIAATIGDFVIRRRDGLIAYHLAVVIDDAQQGITEVVRGIDLLDITPAQIELQHELGLPTPDYMHIPVVTNPEGQKLSKQAGALRVNDRQPGANLVAALKFLHQDPPARLAEESATTVWSWAKGHWDPAKLAAQRQPGAEFINK